MVGIVSGNGVGLSQANVTDASQRGNFGASQQGKTGENSFVNIATGNLIVQDKDQFVASVGDDVSVLRTYNSLGTVKDDNNDNWWVGGYKKLISLTQTANSPNSTITKVDKDGSSLLFTYDASSGTYKAPQNSGRYDTISYTNGQWRWLSADKTHTEIYEVSSGQNGQWRLKSEQSQDGNVITYAYAGKLLSKVTGASGESIEFTYTGTNLATEVVRDAAGKAKHLVQFTYDPQNRLSQVRLDLSPEDGSIDDGNVYVTTYSYAQANGALIASITQTDGSQRVFTYDTSNRVTSVTDEAGRTTTFIYDGSNRKTTVKDAFGNTNIYTYDAENRFISIQGPAVDGKSQVYSYAYTGGNLTSVTDPSGVVASFVYDDNGNVKSKTDTNGLRIESDYANTSDLIVRREYLATGQVAVSRYVYDAQRHLRFAISPNGDVSEYRYDSKGQRTFSISYSTQGFDASLLNNAQTPSLSDMVNWATSNIAGAKIQEFSYDFRGQVQQSWEYLSLNPDGTGDKSTAIQKTYSYDLYGNLLSEYNTQNAKSATTSYLYDGLNRVKTIVNANQQTTTFEYDDVQNVIRTTQVDGRVDTKVYSRSGELISSIVGGITTSEFRYNALGQLAYSVDPTGIKHYYVYDAAGNLSAEISDEGFVTGYKYNSAGQRILTTNYASPIDLKAALIFLKFDEFKTTAIPAKLSGATWSATVPYSAGSTVIYGGKQYKALAPSTGLVPDMGSNAQIWMEVPLSGQPKVWSRNQLYKLGELITYAGQTYKAVYDNLLGVEPEQQPGWQNLSSAPTTPKPPAGLPADTVITPYSATTSYPVNAVVSYAVEPFGVRLWQARSANLYGQTPGKSIYWKELPQDGQSYVPFIKDLVAYMKGDVVSYNGRLWTCNFDWLNQSVPGSNPQHWTDIGPVPAVSSAPAGNSAGTGTAVTRFEDLLKPSVKDISVVSEYTNGRLTKTTIGQDSVTEFVYNASGQVIITRQKSLSTQETRQSINFYDASHRLIGTVDPEGSIVEFRYDHAGRKIQTIQYANTNTQVQADSKLSDLIQPDNAKDIRSFSYYDKDDRLVASINGEGFLTEYAYDNLNLLRKTIAYQKALSSGDYSENSTLDQLRALSGSALTISEREYDVLNRLKSEKASDGSITRLEYDQSGNVVSSITAAGTLDSRQLTQQYDALGRVTRVLSGVGSAKLLSLGSSATPEAIEAVWTNYATKYSYDNAGRKISMTDADGFKTLYFYDVSGHLTHTVNALGEVQGQHFNALGQVDKKINYANRLQGLSNFSGGLVSDSFRNALAQIALPGADQAVSFEYNDRGLLIKTTDAVGAVTSITYDGFNQKKTVTASIDDSRNTVSSFKYNLRGQLQDATEDSTQLKRITHVDYDAFGRAYQTTDANGNVQRRQFDRLGQTIVMTDIASGHQTSTSYDFLGRVLSQTDANQLTTTYKYDAAERSVTITSPGNIVVKKINNAAGQLLSVMDANGNQTSYQYDEDGQLKKTIRPLGTVIDQNLNIYNKRGLLSDSIDANGNLTHIEYDAAQRVLRRTLYSGAIPDNTKIISQTSAIYGGVSANGTFVDTIDANNLKTRSFYDNAGRLRQQVVDPDQGGLQLTTDYTYDNQGHTLTVIQRGSDRTKDRIHRYAYDGLGRRTDEFVGSYVIDTTVTASSSASALVIPGSSYKESLELVRHYNYDSNNNVISSSDALGQTTRFTYNSENREIYRVDAAGGVVKTDYDPTGKVTRTTRFANAVNTSVWTGQVSSAQIEASLKPGSQDQSTQYFYDTAGRPSVTVNSLGYATEFTYDNNGNVLTKTQHTTPARINNTGSGDQYVPVVMLDASPDDRTERFAYDNLNRMRVRISAEGTVSAYEYDAAGNQIKVTDFSQPVANFAGLAAGQSPDYYLAKITPDAANDRVTRNVYDAAGRLRYAIDARGFVTENIYDGNYLKSVTQYAQTIDVAQLGNQSVADLVRTDAKNDRTTVYAYTKDGHVQAKTDALGNTETYEYDALGQKKLYRNKAGAEWRYDYDQAGRLIRETGPAIDAYTIDPSKPDPTKKDPSNALITQTGTHLITEIAYDALGNVRSRTEAKGTAYEKTTVYRYDALGRQIRTEYPAVSVYDASTDTSVTSASVNARTETTRAGLYTEVTYDALGNAVANHDIAGNYSYKVYSKDGHVLFEVDTQGYVTGYEYTAFGEVRKLTRYAAQTSLLNDPSTKSASGLTLEAVQKALTTDAAGNPVDHSADRSITSTYDHAGRVKLSVESAAFYFDTNAASVVNNGVAGKTVRNDYNAFGDLIRTSTLNNEQTEDWSVTRYYYNQLGQRIVSVDAGRYATEQVFDAFGNVTSVKEFATALTDWDGYSAPNLDTIKSEQNRETRFTFDALNHKTSEERINVRYTTEVSDPNAVIGNLSTTYEYDKAGNQISVKDAKGAITYSYYDAMGRVTAVVSPEVTVATGNDPAVTSKVRALTEIKRDILGNVVAKVEYANGALLNGTGYTRVGDSASDRKTFNVMNSLGQVIQTIDANGNSHFFSFDVKGNMAKDWQEVTDVAKKKAVIATRYVYDSEGRLRETLQTPSGVADEKSVKTIQNYNSFGEITSKGIWNDGIQAYEYTERNEYDNAGRIWRTRGLDGVAKVRLYDQAGHQTAEITGNGATGLSLDGYSNAKDVAGTSGLIRTEFRNDKLGRVVTQVLAENAQRIGGVKLIELTAKIRKEDFEESTYPGLELVGFEQLGGTDLKVDIEYEVGGIAKTYSNSFNGKQPQGALISFVDAPPSMNDPDPRSPQLPPPKQVLMVTVKTISVSKKDLHGNWQPVFFQKGRVATAPSQRIVVQNSNNPNDQLTLQLRPLNSGESGVWTDAPLTNFGEMLQYDASQLSAGQYTYRLINRALGQDGANQVISSGTIAVGTSVALNKIAVSGPNASYQSLSWATPSSDIQQVIRYKAVGSSTWIDGNITLLSGQQSDMKLNGLPQGDYEFELLWKNRSDSRNVAHATGKFHIASVPGAWVGPETQPANPLTLQGTTVNWVGYATALHYRPAGSNQAWIPVPGFTPNNGNSQASTTNVNPAQSTDLSALGAGTYDFEIFSTDELSFGKVSTRGSLTVTLAPGEPVLHTPEDPAKYIIGTRAPEYRYSAPVVTSYTARGESVFGPGYQRGDAIGTDSKGNTIYGPAKVITGTYYTTETRTVTETVQVADGQDPVYMRDANGNIVMENTTTTVMETRTENIYETRNVRDDGIYFDATGQEGVVVIAVSPTQEEVWVNGARSNRTKEYYDHVDVVNGYQYVVAYHQENVVVGTREVQVPVQKITQTPKYQRDANGNIVYQTRYRQEVQTRTESYQVAHTTTPADPAGYLLKIESGTTAINVYSPLVVPDYDSAGNPFISPYYSGDFVYNVATQTIEARPPYYVPSNQVVKNLSATYVLGSGYQLPPTLVYSAEVTTADNSGAMSEVDSTSTVKVSLLSTKDYLDSITKASVYKTYDRWSNLLSISDARSADWKVEYKYNANNQVIETTLPSTYYKGSQLRPISLIGYDEKGFVIVTKDANGNINRQVNDALGRITSETHADGGQVNYSYNIFGNKLTEFNGVESAWKYTYDNMGNLITKTSVSVDYGNNVHDLRDTGSLWNYFDKATGMTVLNVSYQYDELNRRIKVTDEAGGVLRTVYDARNNVVQADSIAHLDVPSYDFAMNQFTFDELNRKTSSVDLNGNVQTWSYRNGNLNLYRDMEGRYTRYEYDVNGRLRAEYAADKDGTELTSQAHKSIQYEYTNQGLMSRIRDLGTQTETKYAYDAAGHRVYENIEQKFGSGAITLQNNYLSYDELGRLRRAEDGRFSLTYDYDLNGNKVHTASSYIVKDQVQKKDLGNSYDAMNRIKIADGQWDASTMTAALGSNTGHVMEYDAAGRVKTDSTIGDIVVRHVEKIVLDRGGDMQPIITEKVSWKVTKGVITDEYKYDNIGRLEAVTRRQSARADVTHLDEGDSVIESIVTDERLYDSGNRLVRSGIAGSLLFSRDGMTPAFRQKLAEAGISPEIRINNYKNGNRFDIGNFNVHQIDVQRTIYATENNPNYTGTSYFYDKVGNVVTTWIDKDTNNQYSYLKSDSYQVNETNVWNKDGNPIGKVLNSFDANLHLSKVSDANDSKKDRTIYSDTAGHMLQIRQNGETSYGLLINDEMIGSSSTKDPSKDTINQSYQSAMTLGAGQSKSNYVVRAGDTFASIAKAVWGDSSLWFLIADANGLISDENLKTGQTLIVPARTAGLHNNTGTNKAYNPADMLGDTSPTLVRPQGDDGCGVVGFVVSAAILALAGPAGTFMGNFLLGMAANAAGQVASIAVGEKKEFSFQSAVLAGVGNGVGQFFGGAKDGILNKVIDNTAIRAVTSGAISNLAVQHVATEFGWQDHIDWRGVAAAGAAAGVSTVIGNALDGVNAFKGLQNDYLIKVARASVSGFAAGATASLVARGRIDARQVALDAFGNALGSSFSEIKPEWQRASVANPHPVLLTNDDFRFSLSEQKSTEDPSAAFERLTKKWFLPDSFKYNIWTGFGLYSYNQNISILHNNASAYTEFDFEQTARTNFDQGYSSAKLIEQSKKYQKVQVTYHFSDLERIQMRLERSARNAGPDTIELERANDHAFYESQKISATNGLSYVVSHFGDLANEVYYDAKKSARGIYRLATDSNTQTQAVITAKQVWNDPFAVGRAINEQLIEFGQKPFGEKADTVFKLALGTLVAEGAGTAFKIGSRSAVSLAKIGARELAPTMDDILFRYMVKTGGILQIVPEMRTINGSAGNFAEKMILRELSVENRVQKIGGLAGFSRAENQVQNSLLSHVKNLDDLQPVKFIGECFIAGTLVYTNFGSKPIEEIVVGDHVAARNEFTGETSWRVVKQLFSIENKEILNILLITHDGKIETISSTTEHPFYVPQEGWRPAKDLIPGTLTTLFDGGTAEVVSVEIAERRAKAYNFEVEGVHTYFVGSIGVLVHNSSVINLADIKRLGANNATESAAVDSTAGAARAGSRRPAWLARLDAGNDFNAARSSAYPYNEVYINSPKGSGYTRLDSYDPVAGEIVSRKFTQFSDIQEQTAFNYIKELPAKYPVNGTIANVPSSGPLAGQPLLGQHILEVPVQVNPIPQSVLDAANRAGVLIRDINGYVY